MVDADLGGCHVRGKNGNSVMAGVTFVNESHCYSYSKTIKAICLGAHHTEYYGLTEGTHRWPFGLLVFCGICCSGCAFRYRWWRITSRHWRQRVCTRDEKFEAHKQPT
jgi:hypothetical protein